MKIQTLGLTVPEKRSAFDNPAIPLTQVGWDVIHGGGQSEAGESVNFQTAQQAAVVNACVRLLSNSISAMTPKLYEIVGNGKVEAVNLTLHRILSLDPNEEATSSTLWSTFVSHIALTGNGYIEVVRDSIGNVQSLWNLDSRLTTPFRQPDGTLAFRCSEGGKTRVLKAEQVIHVPWYTFDGVVGVSVIEQNRQTIGSQLAMDKFNGRFFSNYSTPSVVITHTGKVKPEDKIRMRQDWEALHSGANQRRVAILDQEMDVKAIGVSQRDSDYMAIMGMNRQQICGLFQIHPSQIGDTSRVAGETYEQQQLTFLVDCLTPWLIRISQALNRRLIPSSQAGKYFIEHDKSARLRLDQKSQMETLMTARQAGLLTTDEGRAIANMNPIGGDVGALILAPVAMTDTRQLIGKMPPVSNDKIKPVGNADNNEGNTDEQ
jgi:HK97 family phage portal protein